MPGDISGNKFARIIWRFPCPQKILMVTDSSLSFGDDGFGLSEFVDTIRSAGHTVSTAHRSSDPDATIAGSFNFDTAATAVTTGNYDQVWLFGFSTAALSPAEQTRMAQFMQSGGGVFATGDHSTIGAGMGANLPRIRSMRDWSGIPMTPPTRLDTVLEPGPDGVKQFDDQSDAIAQRIYPVFFSNGGPDSDPASWAVHPVLRHPSGAVDYLPDHPHESECLAPSPVAGTFAGVEEWPAPAGGGARIAAQIVAASISAGRFIADALKPPVMPRSFGAVSAYDGDAANVGRIVCDATWHHFVNINLNGAGAGTDPGTGLPRTGLYANGAPTPEYEKIKRYFLNTARWLAPKGRRSCWPFVVGAWTRFDFEIRELQLPRPHPCPWDPLLEVGRLAEETLAREWGPGALAELVDDMLLATDAAPMLSRLLRIRDVEGREAHSLLPLHELRRAIFGSLVNLLAAKLPEDEARLEAIMKDHDRLAQEWIGDAVLAAQETIARHFARALKVTKAQVDALQPEEEAQAA